MSLSYAFTRNLLFHYTSQERALEHILPDLTLRLGPIEGTNDLRESEPWHFSATVEDEELSPNGSEFLRANEELDRNLRARCKLACFSWDIPDERPELDPDRFHRPELLPQGHAHDRMWAQYAGNHSGVCLFFNRARLIERAEAFLKKKGGTLLHGPVNYTNDLGALGDPFRISWDELHREGVRTVANRLATERAQAIYFTKSADWASEQEYRLLWLSDNPEDVAPELVPISDCLEAICLGARFPKQYEVNIKIVAEALKLPTFRIRYMRGLHALPAFSSPSTDRAPVPDVLPDSTFGSAGTPPSPLTMRAGRPASWHNRTGP